MNRITKSLSAFSLLAVIWIFTTGEAYAIPALSREYNAECTTCHTIYPELNEYGEVFYKNGFLWVKKAKKAPENTPATQTAPGKVLRGEGNPDILNVPEANSQRDDEEIQGSKEGKPVTTPKIEALWLAGLPKTVPLSLSATFDVVYNDKANDKDKLDFSTRALSLLAAGVIRDKVGFFAKYNLYSQGNFDPATGNTPKNVSPDIEELYVVWRNTFDSPINIKVGRIRPKLSLWKKSNKTMISDFATTSYMTGSSLFSLASPQDAIEANAILFKRMFIAGGIVDRNGQNSKEGYGHVSVRIGGADFHGTEPDIDFDTDSIWDYLAVTLAGYGYSGKNSISLASTERNNFYRVGVDLDIEYKGLRSRLSGVKGVDNNPDFASHLRTTSYVGAAQVEYIFAKDLIGLFRFEYERFEYDAGGTLITRRYLPAIAYTPIENVKLTAEYQHEVTSGEAIKKLLAGFRFTY